MTHVQHNPGGETVVVGIYLESKHRGEGKAKLMETLSVKLEGDVATYLHVVKEKVRQWAQARNVKVRSVNVVHQPKDIHVVAYIHDRGQGAGVLLKKERKHPVERGGAHGGPLGRETRAATRRTVAANKAAAKRGR